MSFGFPPSYQEDLIITGISQNQLYSLAYQTVEKLNWNIVHTSKNGFIVVTSNNPLEAQRELSLVFDGESIKLHSKSISNFFYDFNRNKNQIRLFIKWLNKQLEKFEPELLEEKYVEISKTFHQSDLEFLDNDPLEQYKKKITFWQAFIPREGYYVTPIVFYINTLIFLMVWATGGSFFLPNHHTMTFWGANQKVLVLNGETWRLLTNIFLHWGFIHYLMNMYALISIGMLLEPEIGSRKFLFAYFLCGLAGSASSLIFNDFVLSAGASGAIFGLYGVFLALYKSNGTKNKSQKAVFSSVGVFVAYNLLSGLRSEQIDNACHIGGFSAGVIWGFSIYYYEKYKFNNSVRPYILSFAFVLLFGYSLSSLFFAKDTESTYDKIMNEFISNEEKALVLFRMSPYTPKDTLIKFIDKEGLPYWKENLSKLHVINALELPDRLQKKNELLITYCHLRILSYAKMMYYFRKSDDVYYSDLHEYDKEIQDVIYSIQTNN